MATGHHHHGANPGREGCHYSAVSGTGRQARRRSRADLPAPVSHEGPGRPWVDAPRLARSALGLSIALALAVPSVARANPQGGQVVAGSVTMTQTAPRRLDVVQSTQKAIVDWRSFSIAEGERTHFQQPSSASVALNRVRGGDPSRILGQLTANGQVMLVNPNGVFFGPGSRVDVGALMATTADIANDDFLAGRYRFTTPAANPDLGIANLGEIQAADDGFVVLAAPHVRNEGTIQARLGRVVLAGAPTFTVDFDGDGLLQFDIGQPVTAAPRGEDRQTPGALVTNSGTVQADGGRVTLTARAADQVIDRVIHMGGVVQAQTVASRGGVIILDGGEVGAVHVAGRLDASGPGGGQRGGTVKVLGERVGLFDGAVVDASGHAGGGTVLIGGNFRGQGAEPRSRRTYVSRQATLTADAAVYGDGGTLIIWSDDTTAYRGRASARGGSEGGQGGLVEVSGKRALVFEGEVDLGAPRGLMGTLLLDPATLTFIDELPTTTEQLPGSQDGNLLADGQISAADPDIPPNTVSWYAISQLVGGNVVLEATGDISVGDITGVTSGVSNSVSVNVASLTVTSVSGSITFVDPGDAISTGGGDLVLNAAGNITAGTLVTVSDFGTVNNSGRISMTAGGGISAGHLNSSSGEGGAGDVTLTARAGNITIGSISAGFFSNQTTGNGGNVVLSAGGNVTGDSFFSSTSNQGDGGSITIDAGGTVSLFGLRSDASGSAGNILITGGDGVTTGSLTATGGLRGGDIGVHSPGGSVDTSTIVLLDEVLFGGTVSATSTGGAGGAVTFSAAQSITPADAVLTTGNDLTFDGPVALAANNAFASDTVSIVIDGAGGNIDFTDAINQARHLILSAGAGRIRIAGAAGATEPLTSLTTNSVAELNGVVTTSDQTYNAALTLSGDYRTRGGAFTVTGPVTVAGASTVATGGGDFDVTGTTTLGAGLAVTTAEGSLGFGASVTGPHALTLSTAGAYAVEVPIRAGPVTLSAGGAVTQTVALTATGLALLGTGPVTLTNPGNSVGTLAADLAGSLTYTDSGALVLGTVGNTTGVRFGDSLSLAVGGGLSQTAALRQTGAGAVTLSAVTGPLVLDLPTNDLAGPVRLTSAGGVGRLTDATLLTLATSGFGASDFIVTAGDLDIADPDGLGTVLTGTGNLRLQPLDTGASIGLGAGAGGFRLTQAELDRISPTFASLTIGREDGQHPISVLDATFHQSVTVQNPAGGQTVIDATQGSTGVFGHGSVTIIGSGATTFLNADIRTTGQPIVIQDRVVLGRSVTLSTLAGAGGGVISLLGALDGAFALTLAAGVGDVTFGGPVGSSAPPTSIDVASARNVSIGALLAAGDVVVNHTGDLTSVAGALDVGSLFINPDATSADVFGRVAGRSGQGAAQAVEGPNGDLDFRVNGYVIAPAPPLPAIPTIVPSVFPFGNSLLADPLATGGQRLRLPPPLLWVVARPQFLAGDPTQAQFSNFGNPELWGEVRAAAVEVR